MPLRRLWAATHELLGGRASTWSREARSPTRVRPSPTTVFSSIASVHAVVGFLMKQNRRLRQERQAEAKKEPQPGAS